jgi:hypothetical protein
MNYTPGHTKLKSERNGAPTTMTHSQVEPALFGEAPPTRRDNFSMIQGWLNPGAAEATIEFGRFRCCCAG